MIGSVIGAVSGAKKVGRRFAPSTVSVSTPRSSTAPVGVDQSQWDANPYANFDYKKSRWQNFLESLGFRTKFDEFKESMALNSAEYDAQLAEKAHNEEYDSPLEQASRQRQAGLNPDLNGSVDSGSSSPMEPDPNAPISPGSDFDQVAQFGSVVMDAVNMASGLASTGLGFVGDLVNIGSQRIDKDNKLLDTAFKAMLAVTTPEQRDNFMNSDMSVQAVNYLPALSEVFGSRRAKKYVNAVNKVAVGLSGHDMEASLRNHLAGEWIGLNDKTAGDGFSMFNDTMKEIRYSLSTDLFNNLKSSAKLEGQKIEDASQYYAARQQENELGQTMPELQALNESQTQTYENLGKQADYQLKQRDLAMRNTFTNLIDKLNGMADRGNWFAGLASIALSFLGSRYLSM